MRDVSADRVRNFERSKSRLPEWGLIFENPARIADVRRGITMSEIGLHVTSPRSRTRRLAERRRKSARQSLSSKSRSTRMANDRSGSPRLCRLRRRRPHSFLESPGRSGKASWARPTSAGFTSWLKSKFAKVPSVTKTPGFEFSRFASHAGAVIVFLCLDEILVCRLSSWLGSPRAALPEFGPCDLRA